MRTPALLAALALAAVAPMGHAASQASASLAGFRFQLTDLNAHDGVAASYNWLSDASSGSTSLKATAVDPASDGSSVKNKGQAFFQYSVNGSSDHSDAAATVGAWSVSANGQANGGNANFGALARTGQGGTGVLGNLSLSAHSSLTITARASVLALASDPLGAGSDWSKAFASLGLTYSYGSGAAAVNYAFVDSLNASASAGGYYDYALNPLTSKMEMRWVAGSSLTDRRDRELKVVFTNTSEQTQYASLSLLTQVSGVGAVAMPAVPEPASAAIALTGLSVFGLRWRRRTRRAA